MPFFVSELGVLRTSNETRFLTILRIRLSELPTDPMLLAPSKWKSERKEPPSTGNKEGDVLKGASTR